MERMLCANDINCPVSPCWRGYVSLRKFSQWYLTHWLIEDCVRRGGCCLQAKLCQLTIDVERGLATFGGYDRYMLGAYTFGLVMPRKRIFPILVTIITVFTFRLHNRPVGNVYFWILNGMQNSPSFVYLLLGRLEPYMVKLWLEECLFPVITESRIAHRKSFL